jgi:hypothetical protein
MTAMTVAATMREFEQYLWIKAKEATLLAITSVVFTFIFLFLLLFLELAWLWRLR